MSDRIAVHDAAGNADMLIFGLRFRREECFYRQVRRLTADFVEGEGDGGQFWI